jgi:polar amino acid transport system ATP-binding protein
MRPRIMLFDDLTSALDPELVGQMLAVMHGLARSSDLTNMIITHQIGLARRIADRVCFFEGGRIVEQRPPSALFENLQSERIRGFLAAVLND